MLTHKLELARERLQGLQLRKALPSDLPRIAALLQIYAQKDWLYAPSSDELFEDLEKIFVIHEAGQALACVALHVYDAELAEIKSLAVADELHGVGLGKQLILACLKAAAVFRLKQVFAVSSLREFFTHQGFVELQQKQLPDRIWTLRLKRGGEKIVSKRIFLLNL